MSGGCYLDLPRGSVNPTAMRRSSVEASPEPFTLAMSAERWAGVSMSVMVSRKREVFENRGLHLNARSNQVYAW